MNRPGTGLMSGLKHQPFLQTQGEYWHAPGRQIITPEHDDDNAIVVVAPSRNWGLKSHYGYGQAFVLYASDNQYASSPVTDDPNQQRVLFRIDAQGGMGCNGMHVATGRNIPPSQAGTQHMWIDGGYADMFALVHNQHAASTTGVAILENSSSQLGLKIDSSMNVLLEAQDNVNRSMGTLSTGGATATALSAADSGLFGVRMQYSSIVAGTTGLLGTMAPSQTAIGRGLNNSANQNIIKEDGSGNLVMLAPDAVGRSMGTLSNSGALAAAIGASDTGFSGARLALLTVGPGTFGWTLQAAAAQTGDLTRQYNSTSQVLLGSNASGTFTAQSLDSVVRGFQTQDPAGVTLFSTLTAGGFSGVQTQVKSTTAATVPLVVITAASNTANRQEWQSSTGAKLAANDAQGGLWAGAPDAVARMIRVIDGSGNDAVELYAGPGNFGARSIFVSRGTGLVPIVNQGVASQTADLHEWQSSTAAVLKKVDSAGNTIVTSPGFVRVLDTGAHEAVSITGGGGGTGNIRVASYAGQDGVTNRIPYGAVAASGQVSDLFAFYNSGFGVLLEVTSAGQIKPGGGNQATGAGAAALGANCPAVTPGAPYTWQKMTAADGSQCYVPMWK